MLNYLRYLRECLWASVRIWEHAERMSVLVAALLSMVAGFAYFYYGVEIELTWRALSAVGVFFGAWFLFLLIFVAPYSVYKQEREKTGKALTGNSKSVGLRRIITRRDTFTLVEAACILANTDVQFENITGPAASYLFELKSRIIDQQLQPWRLFGLDLHKVRIARVRGKSDGINALSNNLEIRKADLIKIANEYAIEVPGLTDSDDQSI